MNLNKLFYQTIKGRVKEMTAFSDEKYLYLITGDKGKTYRFWEQNPLPLNKEDYVQFKLKRFGSETQTLTSPVKVEITNWGLKVAPIFKQQISDIHGVYKEILSRAVQT